ncbi:hypothetical protein [Devosia ginsengisoli]|uniref:hypothetical protein n=1 Tax=Devosia ginsengisoli TaxID=400770 RepID=UPI0016496863|nr:hypothetical protein [Devosia ginsengisoli]
MMDESRPPERADGRKKFVVYLDPKLIQLIKVRALSEERHAYQLVEELLTKAVERGD